LQNLGKIYNVSGIAKSGSPSTDNKDNAILKSGSNFCERVNSFFTDVQDRLLLVGRGMRVDGQLGKHSQRATSEVPRVRLGLGLSSSAAAGTVLISSKRLRKPTLRYAEGMSEMKSSCHNEVLKAHVISSTDKFMHDRTARQLWNEYSTLVYQECHVGRGRLSIVTSSGVRFKILDHMLYLFMFSFYR